MKDFFCVCETLVRYEVFLQGISHAKLQLSSLQFDDPTDKCGKVLIGVYCFEGIQR